MRVLMDYRPALRQRTGVGEYTHQLAKALLASFAADSSDRRLELSVFSSSWKDRLELSNGELHGALPIDRRVPVSVLNLAWHRLGWPPAEALAGRAVDVAHSLHPLIMPTRAAATVITIYDLNFLAHPERTRAEIRRDYASLVRQHACRADHIVVISRFTASEVERQLGVGADRITICRPGAPDWSPRTERPRDGGYMLFVGTLEPRKNVGTLLDVYERLLARRGAAMPPLVLAGRTVPESRQWLDRIGRPPLKDVVRHLGYVDPSKRRELYEGARLLVQPSHEEGFGLPVLEAMTLGVPVVAANRGALPEVLGDAGSLVDPDVPEELAAAIARMLDDEAYEAACAAKGPLRARQFSWRSAAEHAYEAYQLAIDRRGRRARPA